MLAVVACSLAWSRFRDGAPHARLLYALSVAALPLMHLLALTLVAAQVVTGLLLDGDRRWERARRTLGVAALGLLPVLPITTLAVLRSRGPAHRLLASLHNWAVTFGAAFDDPAVGPLTRRVAPLVLVLAGLALIGLRDARRRPLLVQLLCWAVLPPVVLGMVSPWVTTLVPRYFLISVPAWAALAAQGCVVLATGTARAATWAAASTRDARTRAGSANPRRHCHGPRRRRPGRAGRAVAGARRRLGPRRPPGASCGPRPLMTWDAGSWPASHGSPY